jgi:hypothetical protein
MHAQCVLRCAPPETHAPLGALVSYPYHRFIPHCPPIAPAVVEATRDIVSMSSALSPRYLFVTKYLSRLASLSSRCRCLCCIGSLLHFLSSLFLYIHALIRPHSPLARRIRALFIPFFLDPRRRYRHALHHDPSPAPVPFLTHIKILRFAAGVVLFPTTY